MSAVDMSRSVKKGPYVDPKLLARIAALKPGAKTVVKTWSRASTVTPEMVGAVVGVHNGRAHVSVTLTEQMVGHKLGEFAPTRTFRKHGGRLTKELEAKRAEAQTAAAPAAGEKK